MDQYIKTLRVDLLGQLGGDTCQASQILAAETWIEAGSDLTRQFALTVPNHADLGGRLSAVWRAKALAAIFGTFVYPCAEAAIAVVPHYEVLAVHSALAHFGFSTGEAASSFLSSPRRTVYGVETFHTAPLGLRDQISGVAVHLAVRDSEIEGWVTFKRRPRSLGELLEGSACDVFQIHIPRSALLTRQGAPQPLGAVPALRAVLLKAVILPENANERTLLRPSNGGGADDLLRPAAFGRGGNTDSLLKPAESLEPGREEL